MANTNFPVQLIVPSSVRKNKLVKTAAGGLPNEGVDLAVWITWAINQGYISIAGADTNTHTFNTDLSMTTSRTHTITSTEGGLVTGNIIYNLVADAGSASFTIQGELNAEWQPGIKIQQHASLPSIDKISLGDLENAVSYIQIDYNEIVVESPDISIIGDSDDLYINVNIGDLNIELQSTGQVNIGDSQGSNNGTNIVINDDDEDVTITSVSTTITGTNIYLTGEDDFWLTNIENAIILGDPNDQGNSTSIYIDDSSSSISLNALTSITIGDTNDEGNSTKLSISDNEQEISLSGNTVKFKRVASDTGSLNLVYTQQVEPLAVATTSDTDSLLIPAGAMIIGASFTVNTAVTTSAANNTWSAALVTGASTTLAAAGRSGVLDTKVDTLIVPVITTDITEVRFTAGNGEDFATGAIEVVVYYYTLTSLSNFGV